MIAPPRFGSFQEFRAHIADPDFWWPYVTEILERHDLFDATREPAAGYNATNPTFVYGDVVIKIFGYVPAWRKGHAGELAAQRLLATDPGIAAPRLVGEGSLFDDPDAPWPYLITTRMHGVSWPNAGLSTSRKRALAAELGRQIRRVHALLPSGVATHADWLALNVTAAAEHSSLPPHLTAQVEEYVSRLGPFDDVFVHGDLAAMHVFVEDGRLAGLIDWGDAMVTDRHYELIQIHRDTFVCDKALLRVFLEASDWPVDDDFPHKALGHALYRQAVGLTQHHTIDVFMPVAALFPLDDIATLDELATELFAI